MVCGPALEFIAVPTISVVCHGIDMAAFVVRARGIRIDIDRRDENEFP